MLWRKTSGSTTLVVGKNSLLMLEDDFPKEELLI